MSIYFVENFLNRNISYFLKTYGLMPQFSFDIGFALMVTLKVLRIYRAFLYVTRTNLPLICVALLNAHYSIVPDIKVIFSSDQKL